MEDEVGGTLSRTDQFSQSIIFFFDKYKVLSYMALRAPKHITSL